MIVTEKRREKYKKTNGGSSVLIECCLFDLDGTLLSTLDTIRYHLNNTLKKFGLRTISTEECARFIGNGARLLVKRSVSKSGTCDAALIESVLSDYNSAYNSDPIPHTEPYPGISDLVDRLYSKGIKLGVVTNKPQPTAIQLVEHFFKDRFDIVLGGREGAILKPDPTDALMALDVLGSVPSETAFIGDTSVDVETGRNMNARLCVGVSWGFREREELVSAGADAVVDNADELLSVLGL